MVRPKSGSLFVVLLTIGSLAAGTHASANSITKKQLELFAQLPPSVRSTASSKRSATRRWSLPTEEFDALPHEFRKFPRCAWRSWST